MQRALEVRPLDQARQRPLLRQRDFAHVLAHLRRDIVQAELLEHLLLGPAFHQQLRVARFLLGMEQAVFVQPQPAIDRALAHDDVMLLAAGEIQQRRGILRVADHPQVGLDAALQQHAGLGFALGQHLQNAGLAGEELDDLRRLLRRGEQINVPNHLAMPPQAARRAAADHVRMGPQRFQQRLSPRERLAEEMARGVGAAAVDAFENVRLRLLAKPFQPGDLARLCTPVRAARPFRSPAHRAGP